MDPDLNCTPDPAETDGTFPTVTELYALAEVVAAHVVRALSPQLNAAPGALLDLTGAAERLNVSRRTVESLVSVGELAVVRIGLGRGVRRFDPAALDAYIRRSTRTL